MLFVLYGVGVRKVQRRGLKRRRGRDGNLAEEEGVAGGRLGGLWLVVLNGERGGSLDGSPEHGCGAQGEQLNQLTRPTPALLLPGMLAYWPL